MNDILLGHLDLYYVCASIFLFSEMYVNDIKTGSTNSEGEPHVEKETAATAMVDGRNLLGPVVGKFCMKLAIKVGFYFKAA